MSTINEDDQKVKLIAAVKKEVKQVMEESVTRKFIHEESGSVTALCGAVENCLSQGLRRRALGLFKTSSTTALLHKIAKHCKEAAIISNKVQDIENLDPNRRSSSSNESLNKLPLPSVKKNLSSVTVLPKYLWIRLALFEKQLVKIIDYLGTNAHKYYDRNALVADPDYGSILSSLLVGPCALDYTRTKTSDHYWTDPPADELVQRHRISSGGQATPPTIRRPILNFRRSLNTSSETDTVNNRTGAPHILAKDYVESLHQNARATLLFGKNNVLVQPLLNADPMPGYLSLHQTIHGLIIKWTPNQLMNGFVNDDNHPIDKSNSLWEYAMQVRLDDIVYVHCHQDSGNDGTVILVGQDGVQRSPIHFPKGGHMLAFLSCLETGLLPKGRLDPPLWSQTCGNFSNKKRRPLPALDENQETTTTSKDYVFRIIDSSHHHIKEISKSELMDVRAVFPTRKIQLSSTSTSSDSSSKSFSIDQSSYGNSPPNNYCIQAVCDSMRRQIISRAFYGWLAYCRHLSTVRTHLSGLVKSKIIYGNGAENGVTMEKWKELCCNGVVKNCNEVFRLTYFGGVVHELRKDLWPYLLGHFKFGSTEKERLELSEETRQAYENTMSEWLAVEAIVRQRDKEIQADAIAKLSSESTNGEQSSPHQIQRELSNDVFEIDEAMSEEEDENVTNHQNKNQRNTIKYEDDGKVFIHDVIVTDASLDINQVPPLSQISSVGSNLEMIVEQNSSLDRCIETHGLASPSVSACVSPASSNGGVYSQELLETFGLNLHRIEKDVHRCDRNYCYFMVNENLDKLRNVMCTYVWEHLDIGYMQGMCDLVAPLLVIFNDEPLTYACFCHLMERMVENFPNGNAMDCHFANMRSLIQILDSEMYELMHSYGDYTHFYFCYRWFLLDFKRELVYPDVFATWECIWAAQHVASTHFVLFLALALLETYRDIIITNGMDFTDIIKFFNEMAERHNAPSILTLARDLVQQLQILIENK